MLSPGIREPRRNMLICVAVTLVAWGFIAWGAFEIHETGEETVASGLKIALALLPAILGPFMILNFWLGIKVFAAIRRGKDEIGRWTVTAAELAEFAANDSAHNARGGENLNDWTPPREPPPAGLEIIFVTDGVLVGDTYFGLITTGVFRFAGVWMLSESPPAIAFRTLLTLANRFGARTSVGALRIPISRTAGTEAARVLGHYQRVAAGQFVNPRLARQRRVVGRIVMIGTPIFFAVAAVGFVLKSKGMYSDGNDISGMLIIIGILVGGGMLIVALAAWRLGRTQLRKP